MQKFKAYTAYELLELLKRKNATTLLKQFAFHKKAHRTHSSYQIWEEGFHPKLIQSEAMMFEKINYIHQNPVKRGYIEEAEHWRYSSAKDYKGLDGLLEVENFVSIILLIFFNLLYSYYIRLTQNFEHSHLAYLDGYSQIEIANYLELSKSLISKVIKSGDSTAGV